MAHHIRDEHWFREQMVSVVMFRIANEIEELIPASTSAEVRAAIREEVVANSRYEFESLTVDELADEHLIERYVGHAIDTAQYLVNRINAASTAAALQTDVPCADCEGTGAFDLWAGEPCERCDGRGGVPVCPPLPLNIV
ncbi:MAG: hypothetical protein JST11_24055 [Acidobacteria bacterium]|nr:hypothetical protein [Acidobacteriota bacterium]